MPEDNKKEANNQPDLDNLVSDSEMKMPTQTWNAEEAAPKKPSLLGIGLVALIVLLILILGGLYIWKNQLVTSPTPVMDVSAPAERTEPEPAAEMEAEAETPPVSASSEIEAIEADLNNTDFDDLDAELEAMDAEMEAALQEDF